LLCGLSFEQSE
jgi:hypothetical protein